MMRGHALHPEREHHGENRGQPFRHRGNGQRHGQQQRLDDVVHIAEALHNGKRGQHHHGDGAHGQSQHFGDVVHLLLQRGFLAFRGGKQIGDFADLGVHAGAGDDGATGALGDGGAVEHHVGAVAQRLRLAKRIRFFAHGDAFAGQARFRHAQGRGGEQARVGRDGIAFAEHDHIPRHHVGGVDVADGAVSQHVGLRRGHLGEGLDGLFGFGFLNVAKHGVDDEDEHDDDGVERQRFPAGRARLGVHAFDDPGNHRDHRGGKQ